MRLSDLLVNLILGRDTPAKGEIYIEDIRNSDYIKSNIGSIGVILREEAFYDRMTIEEYMKFFIDLLCSKLDHKEIMLKLALLDIGNEKIKKFKLLSKKKIKLCKRDIKTAQIFNIPGANS